MREQKVAKVTISLPKGLLQIVDDLARERSTTRSSIIAELLEKEEEARLHMLMEEGYREMAEENSSLAQEAYPLASEMISRNSRWTEESD